MLKNIPITPLCLLLALTANAAMAQIDTQACNQITTQVQTAQNKIDSTGKAYDLRAAEIDTRTNLVNEAAQNRENLDVLWADVLATRDDMLPLAENALQTLNAGFELMQTYIEAGCTTISAEEVETRRIEGARRFEKGITVLKAIPVDWRERYAELVEDPDPAACIALDKAHKDADASAQAYSLRHDGNIAAYGKARQAVNEAIDLGRDFAQEWEILLVARSTAMPGINMYDKVIMATFDPVKQGIANGCVLMIKEKKIAFEKNTNAILEEIIDSKIRIINMVLEAKAYEQNRNETTSARIGITNNTDQTLCIYQDGKTKGKCIIKPKGSEIVKLQSDDEQKTGDEENPVVFIITNANLTNADEKPLSQKTSICAKRTFDHKYGSKAWIIEAGIEEGCTAPSAEE